jgi:hypothetical protein
MDTTHLEYTAEDLIAHKLQRGGLLVAKPKFDRDGADLIALMEVADGAKFCRIQCKGRTLIKGNSSNVEIPEDYVKGAFWLFLYVDIGDDNPHIYCFSTKEIINNWALTKYKKSHKKYYYLSFTQKTVLNRGRHFNFSEFMFTNNKIDQIKETIQKSVSKNEIEMFRLIKQQQELMKKKDEIYKLRNLINDWNHAEALLKENKEKITILNEQYNAELYKIGPELPDDLKENIEILLRKETPVDQIMMQIKNIIPEDVPERIVGDYISQIMITARDKEIT